MADQGQYAPVPQNRGFGPAAGGFISPPAPGAGMRGGAPPKRQKAKQQQFFEWGFIAAGIMSIVAPTAAVILYPTGVILEPISLVKKLYLLAYGCIMLLVAVGSGGMYQLIPIENGIKTYFALITRVCGKGLFLIFVGCSLWDCLSSGASAMVEFFMVITGLGDVALGVLMVFLGAKMSRSLAKLRTKLLVHKFNGKPIMLDFDSPLQTGLLEKLNQQDALYPFLDTYAQTYPGQALTPAEFQKLCLDQTGSVLGTWELNATFDALNTDDELKMEQTQAALGIQGMHASDVMTYQAIFEWLSPGSRALL